MVAKGRKPKKTGWNIDRSPRRNQLRFLPQWLTGQSGYRGTNWKDARNESIKRARGVSSVDGTRGKLEVNHINPWWLHQGEMKAGVRANRQYNLMPISPEYHRKVEASKRVRPEKEGEDNGA